jgi:hypothetical protein
MTALIIGNMHAKRTPGTPSILSMLEKLKKLKRQTVTQRDKSALLHKARYYVGLIFDSIMQPLEFYLW